MDKTLLKAYIRTIVEEEVTRILPEMLGEAVTQIKSMQQVNESAPPTSAKPKLDRSKLAAMMGLEKLGDTISANTGRMMTHAPVEIPPGLKEDDPAVIAVTKDYSELMKKMGLSK
jgi:hypothetical protein